MGSSYLDLLTSDGAGLFCAVLEHFLKLQSKRPKVLMVQTFQEINCRQLITMVVCGLCSG